MTDDERRLRDLVWRWFFAGGAITLEDHDWMLRQGAPAFDAAFDEADALQAHEWDQLEERRQRAIAGLDEEIAVGRLVVARGREVLAEFDAAIERARVRLRERGVL